jgi:hypothetical protein
MENTNAYFKDTAFQKRVSLQELSMCLTLMQTTAIESNIS